MNCTFVEKNLRCQAKCEDGFVACTKSTPSGCVEDLRVCREQCGLPPKVR